MFKQSLSIAWAALAAWGVLFGTASDVAAQGLPVVAYYPAPPVVTYVPEVRGLFGQRLVYRPVLTAPVAVAAVPAPAAVISPPVTTYYAPAAPARVTTYYAPAPTAVTSYYAPAPTAVTRYYAPAPAAVTSYYAPAAPVVAAPPRVTTYYAPARVVVPPVVSYYPPLFVP